MHLDLSARLARRHRDRIALTDVGRGSSWTFEELERRATAVESHLRALRLARGDRISILSAPCPEMVALFFGAVKVGATLVSHSLRLTPPELSKEIGRVHPALLVRGRGALPELETDGVPGSPASLEELVRPGPTLATELSGAADWEAPALVLFTGGSTGRPKGAVLSLRALVTNAVTTVEGWGLTRDDATPSVYPMFHTGGWNVLLLPLLVAGGRTVLTERFDPAELLRLVEGERPTILSGVPSMFIDLIGRSEFPGTSFASVRFVKSGGGYSPPPVVAAFRDRGIPFYQGYGLTEAGPNLLYSTPEDLTRPGTIGRPNLFADLKLVDEQGREGDSGELWVSGPLVFSGYLDDPETSAAAMAGPYVRTGDVLRRDADGFYFFVGRTKLMFKSGGENIYVAEVEQVLESHPAVVEAAVIGVPDAKWGEVGRAFLVERSPVTDDEIRRFLRERLAAFKVPKSFVRSREIPHTRAGKKDYPELVREAES